VIGTGIAMGIPALAVAGVDAAAVVAAADVYCWSYIAAPDATTPVKRLDNPKECQNYIFQVTSMNTEIEVVQ
jgi:hypothetical protein